MRAWNPRTWATWLLVLALAEPRGALTAANNHSFVPAAIAPTVFMLPITPLSLYSTVRAIRDRHWTGRGLPD